MPIPPLTSAGLLPEGEHECTLQEVEHCFVTTPVRKKLWGGFLKFHSWVEGMQRFPHLYIDGGFTSLKADPGDIDVVLEFPPFSPTFLSGIDPRLILEQEEIREEYYVHFFPAIPGWKSKKKHNDFRSFFQYIKPAEADRLGVDRDARKGILKVMLSLKAEQGMKP